MVFLLDLAVAEISLSVAVQCTKLYSPLKLTNNNILGYKNLIFLLCVLIFIFFCTAKTFPNRHGHLFQVEGHINRKKVISKAVPYVGHKMVIHTNIVWRIRKIILPCLISSKKTVKLQVSIFFFSQSSWIWMLCGTAISHEANVTLSLTSNVKYTWKCTGLKI